MRCDARIAYFSMEIGLESFIPTFSGGLGILAGDTLKSFAGLGIPAVGVTLIHRKGYFRQSIDSEGNQLEEPEPWHPEKFLKRLPVEVEVTIQGRQVKIIPWVYEIKGQRDNTVPVIFLDTDVEGNSDYDRAITDTLYGGDSRYRLCQEIVLGIGGVRVLKALDCNPQKYHMNEGHSALLTLELLKTLPPEEVRRRCVFTTHTPVAAGHDRFDKGLVNELLGEVSDELLQDGQLNMTHLGLKFSNYVNGVTKKHGQVSSELFPGYPIEAITNGINVECWASPYMQFVFDRHIPSWRSDPFTLRAAMGIPANEIWDAHVAAKKELLKYVFEKTQVRLELSKFTMGFARRFTAYKRPELLFSDIERLKRIAAEVGGIQIIFSGKAHPRDYQGKDILKRVILASRASNEAHSPLRVVFLENYSMDIARLMVSGCDVWLNNPERPYEASGTSGMKAAVNGVLHFSTLDGWWLEGHIENVTGWSIGQAPPEQPKDEAEDLYQKLRRVILPAYYNSPMRWGEMMKAAIAINGSFFNTHRMVQQYVLDAYF